MIRTKSTILSVIGCLLLVAIMAAGVMYHNFNAPPGAADLDPNRPKYRCPRHADPTDIQACLLVKFPIGSNYDDLREYLIKDDYSPISNNAEQDFAFRWRSGTIDNFGIVVSGKYSEEKKITSLKVSY